MLVSEIDERGTATTGTADRRRLDADGWARLHVSALGEFTALRALYTDEGKLPLERGQAPPWFRARRVPLFRAPIPAARHRCCASALPRPLGGDGTRLARRLHHDPEQFRPTLREFLARCDGRRPALIDMHPASCLRYSDGYLDRAPPGSHGASPSRRKAFVVLSP